MIDGTFFAGMRDARLECSTSELGTWARCDRQFFYRHVRGLVPKTVSENMVWGTFWHRVIQEFYRGLKNGLSLDNALHNAQLIAERCKLVENKHHGDTVIAFTNEQREALWDTVLYYYDNVAKFDEWDEIVSVEESVYMNVGVADPQGLQMIPVMQVRSTYDLVAKKSGVNYLVDHKTTGDVEQDVSYLALDLQPRIYSLTARNYWHEDFVVCWNFISREVPPGYGHRSVLTETGKERSAATLANMQRKERYVQRKWLPYSAEQHDEMQRELVRMGMMIELERKLDYFPRRIVKTGGMACTGCPYFTICTQEFNGNAIRDDAPIIQLEYTRDPKTVRSNVVIPISPFSR